MSKLTWHTETRKLGELKDYDINPRQISKKAFADLVKSMENFDYVELAAINTDNVIVAGHQRLRALREVLKKQRINADTFEVEVRVPSRELTPQEFKEYNIRSNANTGGWDTDILLNNFEVEDLKDWGFDEFLLDKWGGVAEPNGAIGSLNDTFTVPPFSIVDSRQGYWQDRKEWWRNIFNNTSDSRTEVLEKNKDFVIKIGFKSFNVTTSIFDPVLAEVINLWFGLPNCNVFDPFAGGEFGFIASYLGNNYTGIELRKEQAEANNLLVKDYPNTHYICDSGENISSHLQEQTQDLLFSCPPYYNLEKYSDLPNDASNQKDYASFIKIIETAFKNAIKCLKEDRFAVIVCGDIRSKDGIYYGFPDDIKRIFKAGGMDLYNELIFIENAGTAALKARIYMNNRKVVKVHQNVLVFFKGKNKNINKIYPKLTFKEDNLIETQPFE